LPLFTLAEILPQNFSIVSRPLRHTTRAIAILRLPLADLTEFCVEQSVIRVSLRKPFPSPLSPVISRVPPLFPLEASRRQLSQNYTSVYTSPFYSVLYFEVPLTPSLVVFPSL